MKTYLLILLILLTGSSFTSCVSAKYMTNKIISENGTKIFEANYDDVWDAVKGVLITNGYNIAFEKKEKGILNTNRKLIRAIAQGYAHTAEASGIFRQYLVRIKAISKNQIQVTLTPKVFNGNNDLSEDKVWIIEGKDGENLLWKRFFKDVQSLL